MGHTTRILQTNLASLAFAAIATPANGAEPPLNPIPKQGYEATCKYPQKLPRCPAPLERFMPGARLWLEKDSADLKQGIVNVYMHEQKCYLMTEEEMAIPPSRPEWIEDAKQCYPLPGLPANFVREKLPSDSLPIRRRDRRLAEQAAQEGKPTEAAATAVATAAARTSSETPVAESEKNDQQGWWQQPNLLPDYFDAEKMTVQPQVRVFPSSLAAKITEISCAYSNGVTVRAGWSIMFDNRMLWNVGADCKIEPLLEVSSGDTTPSRFNNASALMQALASRNVPLAGLSKSNEINIYPGKAVAVLTPAIVKLHSEKLIKNIPQNRPIIAEKTCPLPDGLTGKPGEGYIPKDASGFYIIKDDCSRELKVKPLEVKLYKSKSGLNYGIFPNNEVAVETSEVTVTDKLDIDGGSTFALMGLLDSTPTAKANQLLIDNAAKLASQSAARQAVRMGASESAVGLAAALEASGAPILAQIVTKSWQGAAAFGAGYAIGYAGTYGYYAVKEVFNPKALPNPIEEMLKDVDNRPDDPTSSINQCKGQKLVQFNKFVPEKIRNVDLYRALDYVQGKACSEPYTCTDRKLYEASQSEIFQRLRNGTACYESRKNVNIQCFAGGDSKHKDKEREVLRSMQKCRDKLMVTP